MGSLRFNHVFVGLLVLAGLFAFIIPIRISNAVRTNFQRIFWPVYAPTQKIAGILSRERAVEPNAGGPNTKNEKQLIEEANALRIEVVNLSGQLAQLRELEAEKRSIGPVAKFCKKFSASPMTDPAGRQVLMISGTTRDKVLVGQPALYDGGLAGRVDRAQIGGSTVRLVSDTGFRFNVIFGRFTERGDRQWEWTQTALRPSLAEGGGDGSIRIRTLPSKDIKDVILPGDWCVLSDNDWPQVVQRYRVGRVVKINDRTDAPGFAEITVRPETNLVELSSVMIVVEEK